MMKMHAELLRWRQKIEEMRSNLARETMMVNNQENVTLKTVMMSSVVRKRSNLESHLQFCFKDKVNKHSKASDALCEMMCPKAEVNGKDFLSGHVCWEIAKTVHNFHATQKRLA